MVRKGDRFTLLSTLVEISQQLKGLLFKRYSSLSLGFRTSRRATPQITLIKEQSQDNRLFPT